MTRRRRSLAVWTAWLGMSLWLWPALAQSAGIPAFTVTIDEQGNQDYTLSIQILLLMTGLTLLPAALIATTSFLRIIVVLALLRQALGTMQTPSNQALIGLALFLTLFIMSPVLDAIYEKAFQPYMEDRITFRQAADAAARPLHRFMIQQTRQDDLALFAEMAGVELVEPAQTPFKVLVPAFMTSELKTAFQIGFLLFVPFLIIDLVVASLLMSMGMMMLSPMIVSLPFKLMLFVLVDGWELVMGTLANSFVVAGSAV